MKRLLVIVLLLGSVACVDNTVDPFFEYGGRTTNQAVVAVPEFRIDNSGDIPDALQVHNIELSVSEIRFAPVIGQDVAYSTQEPMFVSFDIDAGETTKTTQAVELPEPGRYIVSIRLEPIEEADRVQSFSMDGLVAETSNKMVDDDRYDGTPQPILLDEKEKMSSSNLSRPYMKPRDYQSAWTPFRYESRRSVFYTFNDVELEHGEQFLTFNFDAADWGGVVIDSIEKAVRNNAPESTQAVDVTRTVESNGDDFQRLIETGFVQAHATQF